MALNQGTLTFECMEYNIPDLPKSFGGMSGAGLWRSYIKRVENAPSEIIELRLCGIASFQLPGTTPTRIVCQDLGRITALFEDMRRRWT